jgi:hypothetical protein
MEVEGDDAVEEAVGRQFRLRAASRDKAFRAARFCVGYDLDASLMAPPVVLRKERWVEEGEGEGEGDGENGGSEEAKERMRQRREEALLYTDVDDVPWILEDGKGGSFQGMPEKGQSSCYAVMHQVGDTFYVSLLSEWFNFRPRLLQTSSEAGALVQSEVRRMAKRRRSGGECGGGRAFVVV